MGTLTDEQVREWHDLSKEFWDSLTDYDRYVLRKEAEAVASEEPSNVRLSCQP
jgi:TRAP-type C4-dicarboxylate transport system substrate-binding protein